MKKTPFKEKVQKFQNVHTLRTCKVVKNCQKTMIFSSRGRSNVFVHRNKILYSYGYYISRLKLTRGGYCICDFFGLFFLKNRFLSDYVVPACPKYISGKLRRFSKNFSSKFFHTALFENFLPNSLSVADAKNEPAQGLGTPENRP